MNTMTLKQIGAYQISKSLFKSNTAEYAIGISDTQQDVLLKWVPIQQVSPQGLDRWGQEMRLLKGISCAYTLMPIDMGIEDQKLFIVFENRKIEKLWTSLDFNRFSLREVLSLFIQLSSALSEVHRAGLLYQGLTPGAIALDEQLRQMTLLDFDLSQFSIESIHKTPAPVFEFQLPYISPEQTGILPTHADLRSDLYMLGCVFFEALLKRPVFDIQDPRAWLNAHVSQKVVFTAQDESLLPPPLIQILQKLLEKDPHQRYQSAQGVKSDLEAVLQLVQNQVQSIDFIPGQADVIPELELDLHPISLQNLPQIFGATALEQTPNFWILEGKRGSGKSRLAQQFVKNIKALCCTVNFQLRTKTFHTMPGKKFLSNWRQGYFKKTKRPYRVGTNNCWRSLLLQPGY
jgi:serine/threonine protein kinase